VQDRGFAGCRRTEVQVFFDATPADHQGKRKRDTAENIDWHNPVAECGLEINTPAGG
jgi:hypothetical protein